MSDAHKLLFSRGVRGLADGVVSIVLATYLTGIGWSPVAVGALVTATLLGSAAVTLAVGLLGYRLSRRRILVGAAALMVLTGLGFAGVTTFWPMMVVAVVGTLNPSSGDVSVFLPTEQAALAHTAAGVARTTVAEDDLRMAAGDRRPVEGRLRHCAPDSVSSGRHARRGVR